MSQSTKSEFLIRSYGMSEIGKLRKTNEDTFAFLPDKQFYVLADGMGGHKAGEIASKEAVFYICQSIKELFATTTKPIDVKDLMSWLRKIFINVNSWVHHLGTSQDEYHGMGTTLSSALLYQRWLIYSHVGDSRIYRYRNHNLVQLTEDHTQRHKTSFGLRKTLTRAIGSSKNVLPEVALDEVEENDIYLLCSDGLSDQVKETLICDILESNHSLENKVKNLVDTALEHGGSDNITAILLQVVPRS